MSLLIYTLCWLAFTAIHSILARQFTGFIGSAVSSFGLCTALPDTSYLWIGTSFDERKLRNIYAGEYRRYEQEVPKYFPALVVFKSRQH